MYYEPTTDVQKKVTLRAFQNSHVALHFHKSVELIFVLSGEFHVRVGERHAYAKTGEIVFVPSYFAHSLQNVGETRSYTLIIPENYFKNAFVERFNYFLLDNPTANLRLLSLFERIKATQFEDGLLLQGLIFELLGSVAQAYPAVSQDRETNDLMVEIIKYIQDNFTQNITLENVAAHFGYSKYHFSRRFNEMFGCNLKGYVNRIRFDNVVEMGNATNMTERILSSGFNNLSTFYKMRKKLRLTLDE